MTKDARKRRCQDGARRIIVAVSSGERDWIEHAAKLKRLTVREYVVRAINLQLRQSGVDAVLLRERGHDD